MEIRENINEGIRSIKANVLRTVLTALIIAIGITSLVGILTAVDGIQNSVNSSFADLGANTFTIRNTADGGRRSQGRSTKIYPNITYREANTFSTRFKERYTAKIAMNASISGGAEVKYGSKKTNPNINIIGVDEDYMSIQGYKIANGRDFNSSDLSNNMNVTVIGSELANTLFGQINPVGDFVTVAGTRFTVVGVLEKKGELGGGTGTDRIMMIPLTSGRVYAANRQLSYTITAAPASVEDGDFIMEEARGLMRIIRGDALGAADSFEIVRADSLMQNMNDITGYLRIGGFVIGIITLLGASIALMNIMMVSVTERTREIGIRKSLGATPSTIRFQFLIEAIVVCIIGGVGGLILGLIVGNIISSIVSQGNASFVVPWAWMLMGLVVSIAVGLVSGVMPAIKAARLDPIEALRYE